MLTDLWEAMQGKKTYAASAAGVAYAWIGWYLGHGSLDDAVRLTFEMVTASTIRHGIVNN